MAVGAAAKAIVAWAMRGTKYASPWRTATGTAKQFAHNKVKTVPQALWGKKGTGFAPKKEMAPWMKKVAGGDDSWLGKMKIGAEGRAKFVDKYEKGYKHVKKHKRYYGAGLGGAAAWDILDDD